MFRAARFGVHARLPDADGRLRPVAELLAAALAPAREHAADLGCEAELGGLAGMIDRGGGAGRQRTVHEIDGMDALLRELLRLSGPVP
jgi:carboxylate-amine ligase